MEKRKPEEEKKLMRQKEQVKIKQLGEGDCSS